MIVYNFNRDCKISFENFLCLTICDKKMYKSEFKDFASLYEFIDTKINKISHILFDGYEYFLKKGVLHNLYGAAYIRHCDDPKEIFQGTSRWFYIDGKLVSDQNEGIRGCKRLEVFEKEEIFFFEEISNKQTERDILTGKVYRRKEGIDYIKHPIDLKSRRTIDQRKKKLKYLNDNQRI